MHINRIFQKHKITILVCILFFFLTAIFTFPLVFRINSYIPGFQSTDESYAALWNFWWLKYSFQKHILTCPPIAIPFGIGPCDNAYSLWNNINKWSTVLTNNICAYNIQVLAGYFLSALFVYFLACYLFSDKKAGFFSALIYAFCPYHAVRSWQHLGLAHIQWMALYIFALFALFKNKKLKNAILAAAAFALVMSFDLYYAYFMFIITIIFTAFCLKNTSEAKKIAKFILIMGVFILFFESFDLYRIAKFMLNLKKTSTEVGVYGYVRPFENLFSQSARPLSYLFPAFSHPIFGKFTVNFIGTSLYGESFTEHTLYLGWTPLILAFVAMKRWIKNIKDSRCQIVTKLPNIEDFYIGSFIFLAITAWLFSQPPWWNIGFFKIYMPSFFIYKILPMFRAYCRFGIVVMLAVAVLAGFGLKLILERFKTRKTKIAITIVFCGLVLFEFWNYPPYKVIDVSKVPAVYYWLKEQPGDFIIAEYPLDSDSPNELYKYFQTIHEKKIINGSIPGTYGYKISQTITKLSGPKIASRLKWMGVKYVLVHKEDYLGTELAENKEELAKIPENKGLKLIAGFPAQECPQKGIMCVQKTGPIDVYEIIAPPLEPKIEN